MIAIVNRGGNPSGESKYTVQINQKIITEFTHFRPDGLTRCLQEAAKAVEKAKWEGMLDVFEFDDGGA